MASPHYPTPPSPFRAVVPTTQGQLRVLQIGDITLELDAHQVRVAGRITHIPTREYQMLSMLMHNAGRVVGRRELLDAFWGSGYPDTKNSLEVHILRLRRRVHTPGRPARIRTVRGVGYIFDLPDSPTA
jgi:two-component system response regulator RegX3